MSDVRKSTRSKPESGKKTEPETRQGRSKGDIFAGIKEIEDNIFYNQIVPFFNNYPEDVKKIINEKKYTDVLTYYYNNTNNIQIGTFVSNNYDMLRYGYIPEYSNDTGVLIVNTNINDTDFKLNCFKYIHMIIKKKKQKYTFDYMYSNSQTVYFTITAPLENNDDSKKETISTTYTIPTTKSDSNNIKNISLNNVLASHTVLNNRFNKLDKNYIILNIKLQIKMYLGFRINMFLDVVHDFTEIRLDDTKTTKKFNSIVDTSVHEETKTQRYNISTSLFITNILYCSMFNEIILLLKEIGLYPENDTIDNLNQNWTGFILNIYKIIFINNTEINKNINNDIFNLDGMRDTKIFNTLLKWILSYNDDGIGIDENSKNVYVVLFEWLNDDKKGIFMDLGNNTRHLYVPYIFHNTEFKKTINYINTSKNKYLLSTNLLSMMSIDKLNISSISSNGLNSNNGLYDYFKFFLSRKMSNDVNGSLIQNHLFISDDYLSSRGSWADMMKIIYLYTQENNNPSRFNVYYLKTLADQYDAAGKESLLYKYILALRNKEIGMATTVLQLYSGDNNNNLLKDFGINLTMDFIKIDFKSGNTAPFRKQLIFYEYEIIKSKKGKPITVLKLHNYFDSVKQKQIDNQAEEHANIMEKENEKSKDNNLTNSPDSSEALTDSSVKSILNDNIFSEQIEIFYNYDPIDFYSVKDNNKKSVKALEALDNILYLSAFKTIGDLGKVLTNYHILNHNFVYDPLINNNQFLINSFNFFGVTDTLGGNISAIFNNNTILNNVDINPIEPYPFQIYNNYGKKKNKK